MSEERRDVDALASAIADKLTDTTKTEDIFKSLEESHLKLSINMNKVVGAVDKLEKGANAFNDFYRGKDADDGGYIAFYTRAKVHLDNHDRLMSAIKNNVVRYIVIAILTVMGAALAFYFKSPSVTTVAPTTQTQQDMSSKP